MNLGTGEEISIRRLTQWICDLCGFQGEIRWGTPASPMASPAAAGHLPCERAIGFQAQTRLADGLEQTIRWYESQREPNVRRMAA